MSLSIHDLDNVVLMWRAGLTTASALICSAHDDVFQRCRNDAVRVWNLSIKGRAKSL